MRRKFVVALLALSMVLCGTAFAMEAIPAEKTNPGFVYIGPVGDGGWTYMHDQGRKEMEGAFPGVKSSFVESVPEGPDSARVMETFIRNGSKVIFATSFGYMDFVQEVAKKHPDVVFMHCSGYKRADNVGIYFGRMYQARYLSGLVAGKMTKSNVVGFVAAHPIPEVIRAINAFTLGVRKVNPEAVVKVVWLFSWFDPGKEKEATKALIDSGADVIGMHADSGAAPQTAEEAGVYVVGYNNDMSQYAPTKHLTAPIWDWGIVYKHVMEQVTTGTWESEDIWWGLKEGMVKLAPYGKDVPEEVKAVVEAEKEKIISGTWDVFDGPIKDQSGTIKVEAGQSISDADKLSMSWFVEGVKGDIPK
ncbi:MULTISPECIES: BMP family ABC transporter substrate-binding protein [Aminobacterium]|jgi:basic membrane protein A|uniref:BMP family ABC transporter substrate-binding protein n=1 Tax=Aminobacterium TaxID=81466 RepID=UPI00257D9417|nr:MULTISPECIES: BMP family ABC transporter substrate-binding protein [unclassified Aminobacterium]